MMKNFLLYSNNSKEITVNGNASSKNYDELNNHPNITVYTGLALFLSPTTVQVDLNDGEVLILESAQIVINTGSTPVLPQIPGLLESKHVYTSESLMEELTLPKRLGILGAGHIGLEFASIYTGFGSDVFIFQRGNELLPKEGPDISSSIQEVLESKGVQFHLGTQVQKIEDYKDHVVVTYQDIKSEIVQQVELDAILVATGRVPNIESLNLAAANIEIEDRQAIKVDEYLKTSVDHIWTMGDVIGAPQFTYR